MEEVSAVKTDAQKAQIEFLLGEKSNPVYLDIWVVGIRMALRISDLLNITMKQAKNIRRESGSDLIDIIEAKTNKKRTITIHHLALAVIQRRINENPKAKYLFQSPSLRVKKKAPVTREAVARVFAQIGKDVKPAVKLGTHSMRKTWGYNLYSKHLIGIDKISAALNHSSTKITRTYVGIDAEEISSIYSMD